MGAIDWRALLPKYLFWLLLVLGIFKTFNVQSIVNRSWCPQIVIRFFDGWFYQGFVNYPMFYFFVWILIVILTFRGLPNLSGFFNIIRPKP